VADLISLPLLDPLRSNGCHGVTGQDPLNGVVAIGAECLTSGFGIVSAEPTRTILPDLSGSIAVLQPFVNSSQSTPAL